MSRGVLVIGGGIAGIQAALDLAESRNQVYLVERSPSIGGRMAQLDKTLPTNDCSICILSPNLVAAARHPNIRLLTYSEVAAVDGEAGDFRVTVRRLPRYVDEERCLGCRECIDACVYKEAKFPNPFDMGMGLRKPVYIPFAQAVPSVPVIDPDTCIWFSSGKCPRGCVEACGDRDAIDLDQEEQLVELDVGSIIVATGFDEFDPRKLGARFGYGIHPNVLTGLEFERLLNASGPTGGHVTRPSDGRVPRSVFFVQCVGSRDRATNPFCSRVCCTYAIKQCMIAREHEPEIEELTLAYIDLRTYGKGFEDYYRRGRDETGIRFLKGHPAKIVAGASDGDLTILVEDADTGRPERIDAEMVVLSSAMVSSARSRELADVLGIDTDEHGFFVPRQLNFEPVGSTREGVLLCGCAESPKDIPDSVAQASACAGEAARWVREHRIEDVPLDVTPIDTSGEPRIGVFACHCGLNIGGVVDVPSVADYARTLPGVAYATDNLFTCSDDTQHQIQEAIQEHRLNRVVVAACTPRTHEPIFRETCEKAGLNSYLFEMANIRDQCSWVHSAAPREATRKARDLVRMAVARARLLQPLESKEVEVQPRVLVVGGGIAGIQAALGLAGQGVDVVLVEKAERLGGRLLDLHRLYPDGDEAGDWLRGRIDRLRDLGVQVLTRAEVVDVGGFVGNFEVEVRLRPASGAESTRRIQAGALVLAIGADVYEPDGEFGHGELANVVTNLELEGLLAADGGLEIGGRAPGTVAFVQCVGSRQPEGQGQTGCSRYCCQTAIKQAIALRERGVDVAVYYRDIRTFSRRMEEEYRRARGLGVLFLRYDPEQPPRVVGDGHAERVELFSPVLGEELELPVDAVVLSVGMVPREADTASLQGMLKVPRSADGFFMERHLKLGPVETNTEGIFVCGTALGPKDIADTVAQASAAAAKAGALMSRPTKRLDAVTCRVDEAWCRACGECVEICDFNGPMLVDRGDGTLVSRINPALCKGCGTCAAHCPTGAITADHFSDSQVAGMIDALFETAEVAP